MRYLKRYNESIQSRNKEEISKYINWDLLELSKDISLEFLDEGYTVNIEIRYPKMNYGTDDSSSDVRRFIIDQIYKDSMEYVIYEEDWEHDAVDDRPWKLASINRVLDGPVDKAKFIYVFMVYKFDMQDPTLNNGVLLLDKERMEGFISRVKDVFPDNDIRIHSSMY